jgi:hypothetical protein
MTNDTRVVTPYSTRRQIDIAWKGPEQQKQTPKGGNTQQPPTSTATMLHTSETPIALRPRERSAHESAMLIEIANHHMPPPSSPRERPQETKPLPDT